MFTEELSVAILTLNEERRLPRLLASLPEEVEVVVLDSKSRDQTLNVLREFWKKSGRPEKNLIVREIDWPGFVHARNECCRVATRPWILWMDADEWMSEEMVRALREFKDPRRETVYSFSRLNYFLDQPIRHGGWFPDYKERMAYRDSALWRGGPNNSDVHERLELREGVVATQARMPGLILHEPFLNRQEQEDTNRRYSKLLAEGIVKRIRSGTQRRPFKFMIWIKPVVKFFENYIFKGGFLDGRAGFWIAWGSSQSMHWRMRHIFQLLEQEL